jgi:hypothetical protein
MGWLLVYALVAIGPLVVALTAGPPEGRSFLTDLSVGLGFVGLAMLDHQFATVSRFTTVASPFRARRRAALPPPDLLRCPGSPCRWRSSRSS